jgi:hypothetical protein
MALVTAMEMNNHQFLFPNSFLQSNGTVGAILIGERVQAGTANAAALRFYEGIAGRPSGGRDDYLYGG